jgi:VWFA-related protein
LLSCAAAVQEPVFRSDVNVVSLLAAVQTKQGAIVKDLGKDDFTLLENGRPQTIRYFSRETELPLTIGLMVDTSGSQEKVLEAERAASFRFLDAVLREDKDKVFIAQFDIGVYVRQKLTSSRRELEESLSLVDTQTRKELERFGGGTRLYDSVVKVSRDILRGQRGRKALIIMSDGVDVGSEATLTAAVEAAQRVDTLIYSILFSDGGGNDGAWALQKMSKETGGRYFEVSKKLGIQQTFDLIQEELRSQYSLGYVSDAPAVAPEFRRIQLGVKTKGLAVRARDRYWARP